MVTFEKNFYLRLDLPVDIPVVDKATLLEIIKKKEREWNNNSNHPMDGLLYKRYAEQVPEVKEKLTGTDDGAHDAIIQEAKKIINERLLECVKFLSSKGYVTPDDIDIICKEVPQVSRNCIQMAIQVPIKTSASSTFTPPKKPAESSVKPTDKSLMDKYERLLQVVEKENIYAFLGCTQQSSEGAISDAAQKTIQRALNTPKKTAIVSAEHELAGLVQTEFKKTDAKVAYNLALMNYRAETKLVKYFSLRVVRDPSGKPSRTVLRQDYLASIAEAREIGMSKEEAEWFVYDYYVEKRKCIYPMTTESEK